MKQVKQNNILGYKFEIFEKYSSLFNFTSTRIGGVSKKVFAELNLGLHVGDELENVLKNRQILASALSIPAVEFTYGHQVHGSKIQIVTEKDKGRGAKAWEDGFPETDGLITNIHHIPLMVVTADCAAVSFFDPVNQVIGIAHSGRKGTEAKISQKMIKLMQNEFKTKPEDLLVGIGPTIGFCHYEVDLVTQITGQLLEIGVEKTRIECSNLCTACHTDLFYSYRTENSQTGRFGNILMLT